MNNVLDIDSFSVFDLATLDDYSQSTFCPDPSLGHIQLTMREGMSRQIMAGHMQGLALCLVGGHGEGWPQWKLPAPELERKHCVCWVGVDAGNENNFANAATSYYLSFDDTRVDLAYQHPGAIGLSTGTMHVPEQHDRSTFLQCQLVRRHA